MPTGYTAYIEDGEITTGKEFLKLCTRAFGVAIGQKEEPLSNPTHTKFEPSSYYEKRYNEAVDKLKAAKGMTFNEALSQMVERHTKKVSDYKRYAEKATEMNRKYQKVRDEVEQWVPPTKAHNGIKKFALEQIDMCMAKQKYIDEYIELSKEVLDDSKEAVEKYRAEYIADCQEEVDIAYESYQAELKQVADKNEFMRKFLESLENGEL